MANNVVTIAYAARGAGDTYEEAEANAKRRFAKAAQAVNDDARPRDAGIQCLTDIDPGDGPCAAKIQVEILVSSAGLPEAQGDDD